MDDELETSKKADITEKKPPEKMKFINEDLLEQGPIKIKKPIPLKRKID